MLTDLLALLAMTSVLVGFLYFQIVGIIVGFKKAWYIGLIALLVPIFALVIGVAKKVFGTDILNA